MPIKVSVVVPVYNPGQHIHDCVSSLLRQSLPPDEYEVIFVDDGSTDGTPALLDALAAGHPHVQVIHQENSGWPGKPRNVGIDAAKGEFVMFVDNDDYLGEEALERMYDYGVANKADVIVGKMAGKGRGVPVELFRRNYPHATVKNAPLIDSLTPHKMVRRAFLDRIGLRYPEGRRRLEDHVFVTEAYLRADNVSVLSDYVCYYHIRRDDASNAGFQRFDPVGYFKNLREALDVVERYTEPGPVRDRLFRRWLRNEMVERMRGRRLLAMPAAYRKEMFDEIRGVVVERFGPGVAAGLEPAQQIVAALIAADRFDAVEAFAEWEAAIKPTGALETLEWQDGSLRIGFTAAYASGGQPMTFPTEGTGRASATPPLDLAEAIDWLSADAVARFDKTTVDLLLRERSSSAQFFQPVTFTRETAPAGDGGSARLVLRATATVDPTTAAGGAPLNGGIWDAYVRIRLGGWNNEFRLGPASAEARPSPFAGVVGGRVVLPYWTDPHGNLSLDVDRATKRFGLGRLAPEKITIVGDRLRAALPLHVPGETGALLRLTDTASGTTLDVPGTLTADASGALLEAVLPTADLAGATWRPALSLVPSAEKQRFLPLPLPVRGTAKGVQLVRPVRPSPARRLARKVRRSLRRVLGRAVGRAPEAKARQVRGN